MFGFMIYRRRMNPAFSTRASGLSGVIRLLGVLMPLWLAGCVTTPGGPAPDIRVDDAHGGGSVVAFNRDETLLASGGWEGDIRLYRLPGGTDAGRWHGHTDSVNGLQFLHTGQLLSAGYDRLLVRWQRDGSVVQKIETPAPITDMVANESRDRVVTGHNDGSVRLWRLADLSLLVTHHDHGSAVRAVAYDPRNDRIASSSSDGSVVLWRADGAVQRLPSPPTDAWSLVFAPDGTRLYGGGWFDLYRWNVASGSLQVLPTAHRGIIKGLDFNHDGTALASISRQTDSSIYFLDPETGAVLRRFAPHDLCGGAIQVSRSDHFLATTSDDASVRVWRLAPQADTAPQTR